MISKTFIRYCKKCTIPDTRPDTPFDSNGVCAGCNYYDYRKNVDWKKREKALIELLNQYKSKNYYDCVVASSGGKDSTFQVLKMLEYGMKPLLVTVTTDMLTPLGRKNIENIKNFGVDYMEYTPNPVVRKKLNKICLETVGDISWTEHMAVIASAIRTAIKMQVKLVCWGENPQNENGGPEDKSDVSDKMEPKRMDASWHHEFGSTLGLRASDLIGVEGITELDMLSYEYPTDEEIKKAGTVGMFLGYYIPWDGHHNAIVAAKNGFQKYHKWVEGSIVDYEDLDNYQMRIHYYFKYLKYGFDRASDWSSLAIRRGRMTRDEGIKLTKEVGGKFPKEYLGMKLEDTLNYIGMSMDEFIKTCDKFTNKSLFELDAKGNLIKDKNGDIIKNNYDNV
jgi:N-acetyl sugar amidotransferase